MNFAEQLRADLKKVVEANNPFELVRQAKYKDGGELLEVEINLSESKLNTSVISEYFSDPLRRIRTPLDFTDAIDSMIYSNRAYNTYALGDWTCVKPGKMVLTPKQVIFSGPKTIVLWPDGSKTIVSLSEDEQYDEYAAFCAAVVKKMFGSTHRAKKFLNSIKSCPSPNKKKEKAVETETLNTCEEAVVQSCDNYETDIGPGEFVERR